MSASPPDSPSFSPSQKPIRTSLTLDLSSLPPLIHPSPPSNTLLITNLLSSQLFTTSSLDSIRALLTTHVPLHSFSPLKSFRRIVVSFHTTEDAISACQFLTTSPLLRAHPDIRIYFGEPTPLEQADQHLQAPRSQKMFFISPPPSPPHGWTMRDEGPPNREVHAQDLESALVALGKRRTEVEDERRQRFGDELEGRARSRSRSVVYDPQDHGHSPDLPAVMVEDTTESPAEEVNDAPSPLSAIRIMAHTSRPPVELMVDAY